MIERSNNNKRKPGMLVTTGWSLLYYNSKLVNLPDTINEKLGKKPIIKILDAACGTGKAMNELWEILHQQGQAYRVNIFGIDHQRQGKDHKFSYIEADLLEYNTKEKFDLIVSHETFQYLPDKIKVAQKFYEWLEPEGKAYIHLPWHSILIKTRTKEFFLEDYPSLYKSTGFEAVKICETSNNIYSLLQLSRISPAPQILFPFKFINTKPYSYTSSEFLTSIYQEY